MLLYGASLVYGFTGQTTFAAIAEALKAGSPSIGLIFGLVFVLAGLAFKISAVPFHMWTPDVYEGAPTPVTAFFAAAPKVAAMALFIRVVVVPFAPITGDWQQIVTFISIASMVLGAFAAIGQRNIKRLMAYSSIGHMGFALVGLAAGTEAGVQGVIVYIAHLHGDDARRLRLHSRHAAQGAGWSRISSDLAGLARTNPVMAFLLAMILFSLAGIPPLAGFFAKYYVFLAAIESGLYALPSSACSPASSAPTIICASSRSCISTSRWAASSRCRLNCVSFSASAALSFCSSSSSPARSASPRIWRRKTFF